MRTVKSIKKGSRQSGLPAIVSFFRCGVDPMTGVWEQTIAYPTEEALRLAIEEGTVEWRPRHSTKNASRTNLANGLANDGKQGPE